MRLDLAVPGGDNQVLASIEIGHGHQARDLLARLQRDQVDQRQALGGAAGIGHLVRLELVDLAAVGEEEQVVQGVAGDHVLHGVLLARDHAHDAAPAAVLALVGVVRRGA